MRSGQNPADYGEHWSPATEWREYEACPRCHVAECWPCVDMRARHVVAGELWRPHAGRKRFGE